MDINQIANRARDSIGRYCIEECKALCCRKGMLTITRKEDRAITNGSKKRLDLSHGCPRLKDYKCTIHENKNRPKTCKEFPIFINKMNITISSKCPAVIENKLYAFEHECIKKEYKLKIN